MCSKRIHMDVVSNNLGMLYNRDGVLASKHAAIIGREAFFDPEICTLP